MVEDSPIGNQMPDIGADTQRRDERDSLLVLARLQLEGSRNPAETVRVRNVSSGGLMAQASDAYHVGAAVTVELDGVGRVSGSVAWVEAGRIGIAFDHPVDKARARKPAPITRVRTDETILPPVTDFSRPSLKPR